LWGEQDYFMIRKGEPLRKHYKTKKPSSELVVFSYLKYLWGEQDCFAILSKVPLLKAKSL
jgi:hypothetical protein